MEIVSLRVLQFRRQADTSKNGSVCRSLGNEAALGRRRDLMGGRWGGRRTAERSDRGAH